MLEIIIYHWLPSLAEEEIFLFIYLYFFFFLQMSSLSLNYNKMLLCSILSFVLLYILFLFCTKNFGCLWIWLAWFNSHCRHGYPKVLRIFKPEKEKRKFNQPLNPWMLIIMNTSMYPVYVLFIFMHAFLSVLFLFLTFIPLEIQIDTHFSMSMY